MPLTEIEIFNAEHSSAKPRKIFDGGGLFLLLAPKGGKCWRLKYRFRGKENQIALGVYPNVSLAEARELRDKYREMLADGVDPGEMRKAEKAARLAEDARQEAQRMDEEARTVSAMRFIIDNDGALSFRLGNRHLALTSSETAELRAFLDATRAVTSRVTL